MYSGTGFDSKLKLIHVFKSFPITMWIMQKLYENGTGNQCTLSNININEWQIKRKRRKNVGERGKGMTTSFLCCTLTMVDSVLSCLTSFEQTFLIPL